MVWWRRVRLPGRLGVVWWRWVGLLGRLGAVWWAFWWAGVVARRTCARWVLNRRLAVVRLVLDGLVLGLVLVGLVLWLDLVGLILRLVLVGLVLGLVLEIILGLVLMLVEGRGEIGRLAQKGVAKLFNLVSK